MRYTLFVQTTPSPILARSDGNASVDPADLTKTRDGLLIYTRNRLVARSCPPRHRSPRAYVAAVLAGRRGFCVTAGVSSRGEKCRLVYVTRYRNTVVGARHRRGGTNGTRRRRFSWHADARNVSLLVSFNLSVPSRPPCEGCGGTRTGGRRRVRTPFPGGFVAGRIDGRRDEIINNIPAVASYATRGEVSDRRGR